MSTASPASRRLLASWNASYTSLAFSSCPLRKSVSSFSRTAALLAASAGPRAKCYLNTVSFRRECVSRGSRERDEHEEFHCNLVVAFAARPHRSTVMMLFVSLTTVASVPLKSFENTSFTGYGRALSEMAGFKQRYYEESSGLVTGFPSATCMRTVAPSVGMPSVMELQRQTVVLPKCLR